MIKINKISQTNTIAIAGFSTNRETKLNKLMCKAINSQKICKFHSYWKFWLRTASKIL